MFDFDMSPYAAFVWPCWGISALMLGGLVARVVISARRWQREADAQGSERGAAIDQGFKGRVDPVRLDFQLSVFALEDFSGDAIQRHRHFRSQKLDR